MGDYIDTLPECFPIELKRIILKYALNEEQELFAECYEWLIPVKENKQNNALSKQLINTCAILIMTKYKYYNQMTPKQKKLFNDLIPTLQL